MLGKNMRCDFDISAENMLKEKLYGFLDGVGVATAQGSGVLRVDICDNFLSYGSLNRKDLFEGPNHFFVVCFHCSDYEMSSASCNNQKGGVQGAYERRKGYRVVLRLGEDRYDMDITSSTNVTVDHFRICF